MNDPGTAQLQIVAHEAEVHAVLLMDLLQLMHRLDPADFERQVRQAELELHQKADEAHAAFRDPASRRVLEQRLAYLRAAQIGPIAGD